MQYLALNVKQLSAGPCKDDITETPKSASEMEPSFHTAEETSEILKETKTLLQKFALRSENKTRYIPNSERTDLNH